MVPSSFQPIVVVEAWEVAIFMFLLRLIAAQLYLIWNMWTKLKVLRLDHRAQEGSVDRYYDEDLDFCCSDCCCGRRGR